MNRNVMLFAIAMMTLSTSFEAQRRPADSASKDQTVAVAIALRVNSAAYAFNGQAVCHHVPVGSIYNTLAERWSVQQNDKQSNVNLTLWHPLAGGSDMVTLSLTTGGKTYDVNTVKSPRATGVTGSGTIRFAREGTGGTLTVDVTTASGAKINGTVKCEKFTVPEAVAGN